MDANRVMLAILFLLFQIVTGSHRASSRRVRVTRTFPNLHRLFPATLQPIPPGNRKSSVKSAIDSSSVTSLSNGRLRHNISPHIPLNVFSNSLPKRYFTERIPLSRRLSQLIHMRNTRVQGLQKQGPAANNIVSDVLPVKDLTNEPVRPAQTTTASPASISEQHHTNTNNVFNLRSITLEKILQHPQPIKHSGNIVLSDSNSIGSSQHDIRKPKQEKNSLLDLLSDRPVRFRNPGDEALLKRYILHINKIKRSTTGDTTHAQLAFIDAIPQTLLRREVLKIFVKDIVEKSGFLDANTVIDAGTNITALSSLVNMIDQFTQVANGRASIDSVNLIAAANNASTKAAQTTDSRAVSGDLRSRIRNALSLNSMFSGRGRSDPQTVIDEMIRTSSTNNFDSVHRQRPTFNVGMSIFGNQVHSTTTVPVNMNTSTKREPLGGDSAYWGHLHAGLADILCALCRRRNDPACIDKHCNNNSQTSP